MNKNSIFELELSELENWMLEKQEKKFRASQVFEWLFQKNCCHFEDMKNLPKSLIEKLSDHFEIHPFIDTNIVPDPYEHATKYVFSCQDNYKIESVVLAEKTYKTLCISSQIGCPVGCTFCLTGKMNLIRQLSKAEILAQFHYLKNLHPTLTHVVFMGMGEPLLNLKAVLPTLETMISPKGFNLNKRHITVSTSGYLAGLKQLIDKKIILNLAFSVGHANPLKRKHIMPCELKNPIIECARLIKQYQSLHNRKLTLEYTLLEGVNEDRDSMQQLANLARYLDAKVNLINLNPHPKIPHKPIAIKQLKSCKNFLSSLGIPNTIRYTKGQKITAACGQLGESFFK